MGSPGIDLYRRQQNEAMSPEELVLVIYEQGILACRRKDHRLARRVITELIGALDFDHEEMAGGFLSIYDWVMRLVREGDFEEAGRILTELHATWKKALGANSKKTNRTQEGTSGAVDSLDAAS